MLLQILVIVPTLFFSTAVYLGIFFCFDSAIEQKYFGLYFFLKIPQIYIKICISIKQKEKII